MCGWFRRVFQGLVRRSVGVPRAETSRQRAGRRAEEAAGRFLESKGMRILARNWRAGRDEIDLVARDGEALVFVEVRARGQDALVPGYHSLTRRKREALRRVCRAYLSGHAGSSTRHPRFDVIEVALTDGDGVGTIRHYANISLLGAGFRP